MFSAALGLSQGGASHKLRGYRPWTYSEMTKAAEFLGEDLSGLVDEAERARRDSNPKPSDLDAAAGQRGGAVVIDLATYRPIAG